METVLWRNHSRWERCWAELKAGGKLVDLETENKVGLLELGRWEWRQPGASGVREGAKGSRASLKNCKFKF